MSNKLRYPCNLKSCYLYRTVTQSEEKEARIIIFVIFSKQTCFMPLIYTHENITHQFTHITFQNNKTPAFNQHDSSHTGETKRHKYEIPSAEQMIRDCMYESSFSTQSHSPGLCRLSLSENKRHASQILMHSSINLSSHQNLSTQNFLWHSLSLLCSAV